MNKGLPTVFYSCQVYSLNLIIEVRISDYFIFILYLLFYIILFYAVGFFLIVVKYIVCCFSHFYVYGSVALSTITLCVASIHL